MEKRMTCTNALQMLRAAAPQIHCLTNTVTMNDVANVLLAIGGSAIMAQDVAEVEEITAFCHGTLLNTGTPDTAKFVACELAGKQANRLRHPVVLDPVGVGASRFRREHLAHLLNEVQPGLIRCNMEEASVLFQILSNSSGQDIFSAHGGVERKQIQVEERMAAGLLAHGGVESKITAGSSARLSLAAGLARISGSTVLISGSCDAVSDGKKAYLIHGGDARVTRITGSGCMLSALCAAFLASGLPGWQAACAASQIWKYAAIEAGRKTDCASAGIGSFHVFLLDALSAMEIVLEKITNSICEPDNFHYLGSVDSSADIEEKELVDAEGMKLVDIEKEELVDAEGMKSVDIEKMKLVDVGKEVVRVEDFTGNIPPLCGI